MFDGGALIIASALINNERSRQAALQPPACLNVLRREPMLIRYLLLFSKTLGETRGWRVEVGAAGGRVSKTAETTQIGRFVNEAFVSVCHRASYTIDGAHVFTVRRKERWWQLEVGDERAPQ